MASLEFPAPVASWGDAVLADGLNGVPIVSAYRAHTWALTGLDEDCFAQLAAFKDRQQLGTATGLEIETDAYGPECDDSRYRTTVFTDVVFKELTRERGYPNWQNIRAVFEILVS